ncbi:hypothetical protein AWE51_00225 [Aquimarina aggregata]|uniref:Uncharacterized protein n=1 Tax=Aquimarina aggregata TaxID=1642818 RepID=A0A162DSL6_9FLAO|nr:hypothetical protein [Aquimarina aggregata]KZS41907.1 hypothetical protein AWE51_00225 [Aquimarina aggregata]
MDKYIILIVINFLIINSLLAQQKVVVTKRDGSVINGYGRVKLNNKISFRNTEDGEKVIYDYKTVKNITFLEKETKRTFEYKLATDGGSSIGEIKLLQVIINDKVNLYLELIMQPNSFGDKAKIYYISKKGEDTARRLGIGNTYSRKFKRVANKYFQDCPDLLQKISNKYFKRYNVENVVKYYLKECD